MANEIQPWRPSTGLSIEQRAAQSRAILQCATSPQDALRAGKRLLGQWPHARPPDPEGFAAAIGAVLAQYPIGVVEECCDPRRGLAREREFPPTVAAIVEWCDRRLAFHQLVARYQGKPRVQRPEPEFSAPHRESMIERFQVLLHGIFSGKETEPYVRPVGRFERVDDEWNRRRPGKPQPQAEGNGA